MTLTFGIHAGHLFLEHGGATTARAGSFRGERAGVRRLDIARRKEPCDREAPPAAAEVALPAFGARR